MEPQANSRTFPLVQNSKTSIPYIQTSVFYPIQNFPLPKLCCESCFETSNRERDCDNSFIISPFLDLLPIFPTDSAFGFSRVADSQLQTSNCNSLLWTVSPHWPPMTPLSSPGFQWLLLQDNPESSPVCPTGNTHSYPLEVRLSLYAVRTGLFGLFEKLSSTLWLGNVPALWFPLDLLGNP